jgi:hypothetical protein
MTADKVVAALRAMLGEFGADEAQADALQMDTRALTRFRMRLFKASWPVPHVLDGEWGEFDIDLVAMDDANLDHAVNVWRGRFAEGIKSIEEVGV